MVIKNESCLGPDIWSEALNQDTSTENIILIIEFKKTMKQSEINL